MVASDRTANVAPDLKKIRETVSNLRECDLKTALLAQINRTTKDVDELREHLAAWFDETMDRVSGWYKRKTQWALLVIALAVCGVANADSLMIAERLHTDDELRAQLVEIAAGTVKEADVLKLCTGQNVGIETCQKQIAARALAIPLGWSDANVPSGAAWLGKVLGILVTAGAVMLGAPFWFDLLGKLVNLRNAGRKPKSLTEKGAVKAQGQIRHPRAPAWNASGAGREGRGSRPAGSWATGSPAPGRSGSFGSSANGRATPCAALPTVLRPHTISCQDHLHRVI